MFQTDGKKIALMPLPPETTNSSTSIIFYLFQSQSSFARELEIEELVIALNFKQNERKTEARILPPMFKHFWMSFSH